MKNVSDDNLNMSTGSEAVTKVIDWLSDAFLDVARVDLSRLRMFPALKRQADHRSGEMLPVTEAYGQTQSSLPEIVDHSQRELFVCQTPIPHPVSIRLAALYPPSSEESDGGATKDRQPPAR